MSTARRPGPKRHHYVPRTLLNRFATERKKGKFQIHVFDKATDSAFKTAVENIAVETDFNTLERSGLILSLESGMGAVEDRTAPLFERITESGSIIELSVEDRANICIFAALQFLRGADFRARFGDLTNSLRERIARMSKGKNLPKEIADAPSEDDLKAHAFQMILESLGEFSSLFADKDMLLFKGSDGHPFQIGDAPIAMTNKHSFGPYGNIGLAVPGIQIFLPISSQFALAFWCPSILVRMSDQLDQARLTIASIRSLHLQDANLALKIAEQIEQLELEMKPMEDLVDRAVAGKAILAAADNVIHLNSLQVRNAERWVMSSDGDFSLAKRMIRDDQKYKTGIRAKVD